VVGDAALWTTDPRHELADGERAVRQQMRDDREPVGSLSTRKNRASTTCAVVRPVAWAVTCPIVREPGVELGTSIRLT